MLEEFDYDKAHCYGVHKCVAIQMWRGEVLPSHVPLMEGRWKHMIQQHGTFAILVVVLPSAPPPSPARREEIKNLYGGLANHIAAVGTVLDDQGIKGTAGAMVMTTIMLMSRTPYPYKNGTNVEPMAAWLCDQIGRVDPYDLVASVGTMRQQFADIITGQYGEPFINRLRTGSQ
jgi:hypothetical protein